METGALILPDNTLLDTSQPPPGFEFPKPDFSEVVSDEPNDVPVLEKNEGPLSKPTFKNALQAKKRLQAFSSTRSTSLPSSPSTKKFKTYLPSEEKTDEAKKINKKANPDDKAKAVIEEIEEMKREEQAFWEAQRHSSKRSRSRTRSKSPHKGRFKKVDKKTRNYRKRSVTPEKSKKVHKKLKKYPKNWKEFKDFDLSFNLMHDFEVPAPVGNNELLRQILFESPSLPIAPFKMKTVSREDKLVPFEYQRYTRSKPVICYSVNSIAIKDSFLSRKLIFDTLPKQFIAKIEHLYSSSLKFKVDLNNKNVRNWFPKEWDENDDQCRLLEKSIGLSFLQTYTGEEDENELAAEDSHPRAKAEEKCSQINKDETQTNKDDTKKKRKKEKSEISVEKKKKSKEKKKPIGENTDEIKDKRKKRKKDKTKKREKKKLKQKKSPKDKKKKDKKPQIEVKVSQKDKLQKPNKELIAEESKIIEDKSTKKKPQERNKEDVKEEKTEKDEMKDKVITRKRKHSEHDEKGKKVKFEKHKKGSNHKEEILRKKSTIEKHVESKTPKSTPEIIENLRTETAKSENVEKKKKKSRWSDLDPNSQIEAKSTVSDLVINKEEIGAKEDVEAKETTPDTDEYHSHWESDDDVSSSIPRQSIKMGNRNWESDEELFDRTRNINKTLSPSYSNLEIPLNIVKFSRRTEWTEKPLSYVNEIKLLEEERKSLSEERKKLELERQRILKLQEEAKLEIEDKIAIPKEKNEEKHGISSSTPEMEENSVKKENADLIDFNIDSLNNSLLSNVSSVESNFPIAALENQYEEFIKAVSSDNSVPPKKKLSRSSSSSSSSSDSDHKKKKRKKKKRKKRKMREVKSGNIFDEFDIPVPSDLPEIVPTPVPVPSPNENIVPLNPNSLILQSIIDVNEQPMDMERKLTKPFIIPSIVLPSKKTSLVDNSNLKLNDDSDSVDFTDKFVKKSDEKQEKVLNNQELSIEHKIETIIKPEDLVENIIDTQKEKFKNEEDSRKNDDKAKQVEDKAKQVETVPKECQKIENKKNSDVKSKRSRSSSPQHRSDKTKEKKRSRSRSRSKKRSPVRRKEPTPPLHRRYSSPRRRSPPRRRGSPRRYSPSPRRRISSPRRRRRSLSISPPRSRIASRKRSPSPRIRRSSPLNSPLDGFKRSVADSTISDDMLPQPTPEEYSESPPLYRKGSRRESMSPHQSPRRISLDDRINQVLGLEKAEQATQPPLVTTYPPNYQYPQPYSHQYGQYQQHYNQFSGHKSEYIPPFVPPPVFTQPPPPIVKPVPTPTPTKVVQVGNILQVVPNEEITATMIENKIQETSQKILQVGNMLQIVPAVIPPSKPPILEPAPLQPPQTIEIPSAESIMKQKNAERKAEREKRRQERERRRKEKEKKRREREKRKQMKLKIKAENMIKRAIQLEAEALASEDLEEDTENTDLPVQWPPVPVVVASSTPSCKGILLIEGSSRKRKSVQFADGVKPGEGTSPSGGEELSSPPPTTTKLPKEKRYKKIKIPKKNKKKKIKVKVVKKVQNVEDDDDDDSLPPPSPPPGSPPQHLFPSRVKTHTINNVHQYIGNIIQAGAPAFPFRPPMPVIINRHQPPPGYMPGNYHGDVSVPHPSYQGVPSHH